MHGTDTEEPVLTVEVIDHGAGTRLVLNGDLDLEGAKVLAEAVERLDGSAFVELDLSGVEFLDSSGLRSLLIHRDDRGTTIVSPSRAVTRTCELAAVEFLFDAPTAPTS